MNGKGPPPPPLAPRRSTPVLSIHPVLLVHVILPSRCDTWHLPLLLLAQPLLLRLPARPTPACFRESLALEVGGSRRGKVPEV